MTTSPTRAIASAAGLAGCFLLAACGTSSPTTHAAAKTNSVSTGAQSAATNVSAPVSVAASVAAATGTSACALVTEQDATSVLGKDPGPGSTFASHGSTQCQYGSYQSTFLLVNLTPTQGKAGYDLIRHNRQLDSQISVVDIAGVGDRAFEVSQRNTAGIYVNKGDAVITISLSIQTATSPPHASALALAKIAASRV